MAKTTFIKLDRDILNWRWYTDINTKVLFIHLLLKANIKDRDFQTVLIKRGELVTSYPILADETGLTYKQVRVALEHLQETGEVAVKRQPKFSIISILNYDLYQSEGSQRAVKGQSENIANRPELTDIDKWENVGGSQRAVEGQSESVDNSIENDSQENQKGSQGAVKGQSRGSQGAVKGQQSKNDKNDKKDKNINIYIGHDELKPCGKLLYLSDRQLDELAEELGIDLTYYIDKVDDWLQTHPRPKEKHYQTIRTFIANDKKK